ncbi:tol-pal system protein YbgF [Devosia rhizoryzae]|uniref:Cell division coordinator CpoB n=1 Tax=Devosia rhizoryzae TaxID=2774137 RepID=A0ABX7C7C9_9HYPH|nr:tol-pal system protein YbgF [Devosia rhizoryzae]QQR39688.1 tol-pal system protein YbgF [Devosia rhizoryzae]
MIANPLARKGRAALCALAMAFGVGAQATMAQNLPGELSGLSFTNGDRILVAQADSAQLMVRVQQLEEQIRSLNGQMEGLTFQLTQMQEILNRLQEAQNGAAASQPAAAPQTPASPDDAAPATEIPAQGVQPLPGEVEFDPTFDDGTAGESADPLVGTNAAGGVDLATGQPLDLAFDPAANPSGNADADAQFRAGYEALVAGDYDFAEEQFGQFMELYPDNPQLVDAANWRGEALIAQSSYAEAADVLVEAYQKAPDHPRAPDILMKLGVSLAGVGERETACRTFAEVSTRYPEIIPAFQARLAEEKAKAECPPA